MSVEMIKLTDDDFPLTIIEHHKENEGQIFESHLHQNHLQIFLFTEGKAAIYCDDKSYKVSDSDILLINNNELHYGESMSSKLEYYVFRLNIKLLNSYLAACSEKYFAPLLNGMIEFEHMLIDDEVRQILLSMIGVYKDKENGYELKLISLVFSLMSLLFKDYIAKNYTEKEKEVLMKRRSRFAAVFEYINNHYNDEIALSDLTEITDMSEGYFCRMFKKCTGHTPIDYINRIRIFNAAYKMNEGICNVTEAALSCGFDDMNYFSRVFKKYMGQSPRNYIRKSEKYRI